MLAYLPDWSYFGVRAHSGLDKISATCIALIGGLVGIQFADFPDLLPEN